MRLGDLRGRPCRSLLFAHLQPVLITTTSAYYKITTFTHFKINDNTTVVPAFTMMITTTDRMRAISASLRWANVAKNTFLLAGPSATGRSRHRTLVTLYSFPSTRLCCGAVLFLAIGATTPSVGGSVAVAYQAIGRTLHKRWLRIRRAI